MERGDASGRREGADPAPSGDAEAPPPQIRRGLFGYRRKDVEAAMAAWDRSVAELRDEVAALWVAFAEHDRAIDAARSEQRASVPAPPPAPPAPPETTRRAVPAGRTEPPSVEQQLADLDDVLSAIETATRTLEQNYSGELAEEPEAERLPGVSPAGDRDDSA